MHRELPRSALRISLQPLTRFSSLSAANRTGPKPPLSADPGATAIRRGRILVVEDEYFIALDLEHRLVDAGFEVVAIAGSAEEAFELAASHKPDLTIMDIRLAGPRDGVDAAIDLARHLGIPSIFATAHADLQTRQRAEQASPLGWLQKPYSSEALIRLVSAALAQKRQD